MEASAGVQLSPLKSTHVVAAVSPPAPSRSPVIVLAAPGPGPGDHSITDSTRSFEEERAAARTLVPAAVSTKKSVPLARALTFTTAALTGKRRIRYSSPGSAPAPAPAPALAESIIAYLADLQSANASLSVELERERIALSEVVCYSRRLQSALESCVQTQTEVEDQALRSVSVVQQEAETVQLALLARIEELEVKLARVGPE